MGAIPVDPLWWQNLFDEVYLITDARSVCNEELTRREVDFLEAHLQIGRSDTVLDLCGGHGRHSLELTRRGYGAATVLDYSRYLVRLGKDKAGERFDFVLVMANSFGYFPDDSDNLKILCEAYRLCRPGGTLLLDLLDSDYVVENFQPSSVHKATEDITVNRERELSENLIRVRETVVSGARGLLRESAYCERLYREDEVEGLLQQAGFGRIDFKTDFSSHANPGDYGFMTQRVIVTAVRG